MIIRRVKYSTRASKKTRNIIENNRTRTQDALTSKDNLWLSRDRHFLIMVPNSVWFTSEECTTSTTYCLFVHHYSLVRKYKEKCNLNWIQQLISLFVVLYCIQIIISWIKLIKLVSILPYFFFNISKYLVVVIINYYYKSHIPKSNSHFLPK